MAEISQASGVKFRPRDMRRTFGYRLWEQGVELETIALLMRHDNPNTTFKCYIGVTEDRLAAAMDKLAPKPLSQSNHDALSSFASWRSIHLLLKKNTTRPSTAITVAKYMVP